MTSSDSTHYSSTCEYKYIRLNNTELSENEKSELLAKLTTESEDIEILHRNKSQMVKCLVCRDYVVKSVINSHLLDHFFVESQEYLRRKIRIQNTDTRCKIRSCPGRKTIFTNENYMKHLLLCHGMFRRYCIRYHGGSVDKLYIPLGH